MSTPASRLCGLFGEGLPGTPAVLRGVRGALRSRQASEVGGPAPGAAAYLTASSVTLAASFDLTDPGVFTCRKGAVSSSSGPQASLSALWSRLWLGLGSWRGGPWLEGGDGPPAAPSARARPSRPARAALAEGPEDLLGSRPGVSPDCVTVKWFLNLRASGFSQ